MIDRNGQIKKEHKHLVVHNSTEPPDGSVPGYTALSAVSSPSSRSSGPLSSSSPPLLPLAPSVSAVVGSNTATPGSPASAGHARGSTGGSNAGGASGGGGESGTCSPPPVTRSSPAAPAGTVPVAASYDNSKHVEGAPLCGSTPAGTSGILSSGGRSRERLHEEEDTAAKPPTPLPSVRGKSRFCTSSRKVPQIKEQNGYMYQSSHPVKLLSLVKEVFVFTTCPLERASVTAPLLLS